MKTLFQDNAKANSQIRTSNVEILKGLGFETSGLPSRSGQLTIISKKTKAVLTFGLRCNMGGHQCKYFSLAKSFKTEVDAIKFVESTKKSLLVDKAVGSISKPQPNKMYSYLARYTNKEKAIERAKEEVGEKHAYYTRVKINNCAYYDVRKEN